MEFLAEYERREKQNSLQAVVAQAILSLDKTTLRIKEVRDKASEFLDDEDGLSFKSVGSLVRSLDIEPKRTKGGYAFSINRSKREELQRTFGELGEHSVRS